MIGAFVQTPSRAIAQVLAASGIELLVADGEHAPLSPAEVEEIIVGALSLGHPVDAEIADVLARARRAGVDTGTLAGAPTPRRRSGRRRTGARAPSEELCDLRRLGGAWSRSANPQARDGPRDREPWRRCDDTIAPREVAGVWLPPSEVS